MQPDEPDNAQSFKGFWKEDVEKLNVAWPALFRTLGPNRPYRGYGPAIPPKWIIRDYEKAKAADPTRPMFLGMGQGVAWEKYIGRGERTGHLEDYAEYMKGCDIAAFDIYPAAAGNLEVKDALWYVPLGIRRLRERCGDHKPAWAHIETGIISSPSAKPAPLQVKAEVWMAIIHGTGASTISCTSSSRSSTSALLDDPEMLAMVTSVNRQIRELARVLNSPTVAAGVAVDSSNAKTPVHALVKRQGGATYVLPGDVRRADHGDVPLAGSGGTRAAQVLGEDARFPLPAACSRIPSPEIACICIALRSSVGAGGSRAQGLPLEARGAALHW